jgi:hypothetical protein
VAVADAVAASADGDVITLDPGVYDEVITLDQRQLSFAALGLVTWRGANADLFTVRGGQVTVVGVTFEPDGGRAVRAEAGASLQLTNVEVHGNAAAQRSGDGAAVRAVDSDVVIDNGLFAGNRATSSFADSVGRGGHLYVTGGSLTVRGSALMDGLAGEGGAIAADGAAEVALEDCTFTDHEALGDGGAIWLDGAASLTMSRVSLRRSTAGDSGAGVFARGGAHAWDHVDVQTADAGADGGAAALLDTASITLTDMAIFDTSARRGGGLSVEGATEVRAERLLACGNLAAGEGGLARVVDTDRSSWAHLAALSAAATGGRGTNGSGGALFLRGGAHELTSSDLLDSGAAGEGGAVRALDAALRVRHTLFAWTLAGEALSAQGGAVDVDWSAWWANTDGDTLGVGRGANAVQADPELTRYRRNGVCGDDDLRLRPFSPLRDAGDPSVADPDGTRVDVGATGGVGSAADLWLDLDSDGTLAAYDCDDASAQVGPGEAETCNGVDDDCDGDVDVIGVVGAPTWYPDADGDGVGGDGQGIEACAPEGRWAPTDGDCDDLDPAVAPGAVERCDDVDNDCNGNTDGPDAIDQLTWYRDVDADGFGTTASALGACNAPQGYALSDRDCDDGDPAISPAAEERCDNVDNDCDLVIDGPNAIDPTPWYADGDGDGFGADGPGTVFACDEPGGLVRSGEDCDDADPAVHPYAAESCAADASDRNCDGFTGDVDHDGDGFAACEECDDADPAAFPGAEDPPYDGLQLDCDRTSDFDADGDGHDADAWGGDDCDDADPLVSPSAEEILGDAVDSDCDGDPGAAAPPDAGCGCDQSTPSAPSLVALLALGWARRRRSTRNA